MKLSSLSVILTAAAGLVSAAPIRIVIISSGRHVAPVEAEWLKAVRWGHAAAPSFLPPGQPANPTPLPLRPLNIEDERLLVDISRTRQKTRKGGCRGMRAQSLQFGNKLRIMLGMLPVELTPHHHGMMRGAVVGTSQRTVAPIHYRHHIHPHVHRTPLAVRLSHALASLGPWEGRAVSFVLGCGLGAILRMLFVFGVLIVRSIRARSQERRVALPEEDVVVFVVDVKEDPIAVENLPAYAEKTDNAPASQNAAN